MEIDDDYGGLDPELIDRLANGENHHILLETDPIMQDDPDIVPSSQNSYSNTKWHEIPFNVRCQWIINHLSSPENDRWYPQFVIEDKSRHARQNFRRKMELFQWSEERQMLFHSHTNGANQGNYSLFIKLIE